jgi:hypothetical protein
LINFLLFVTKWQGNNNKNVFLFEIEENFEGGHCMFFKLADITIQRIGKVPG